MTAKRGPRGNYQGNYPDTEPLFWQAFWRCRRSGNLGRIRVLLPVARERGYKVLATQMEQQLK